MVNITRSSIARISLNRSRTSRTSSTINTLIAKPFIPLGYSVEKKCRPPSVLSRIPSCMYPASWV